ncbi:hypothetical protein ACJJTC_002201 [Scirpophaga incertulas]
MLSLKLREYNNPSTVIENTMPLKLSVDLLNFWTLDQANRSFLCGKPDITGTYRFIPHPHPFSGNNDITRKDQVLLNRSKAPAVVSGNELRRKSLELAGVTSVRTGTCVAAFIALSEILLERLEFQLSNVGY